MKSAHLKRLSAVLLLLAMLVSLAACGKEETPIEKTARYLQAQIPEPNVRCGWRRLARVWTGTIRPQGAAEIL